MPGWLLRAAGDLFSAQNRVDSVINDEVGTFRLEEKGREEKKEKKSVCCHEVYF